MGCGESKQAVSTENTLIKSKSKARKSENTNNLPVEKPTTNDDDDDDDAIMNNSNAGENVKENEKIPLMEKENDHSTKKDDEKEKQVLDHGDNQEPGPEKLANKPVVVVEENIKGEGKDDEELKGGENENVTHKKETIEPIVSEGISGKSDYYLSSYPKGHASEGNTEENDSEDKLYKKEEVLKVEEVKVLSGPTDEPKPSENEIANAASTTEIKAN